MSTERVARSHCVAPGQEMQDVIDFTTFAAKNLGDRVVTPVDSQ